MDCMVLSRKHIYRTYELRSSGTESDFFQMDKTTGIKVFKDLDRVQKTIPNKLKKIERTVGIERPGIKYPRLPIFDEKGNLIGYTVDIFETANYIKYFCDLAKPCISMAHKVYFYKLLEALVQSVHDDGSKLVDTNPENFLIGICKDMALIDTDNYMHPDCPCDNIPCYPAKYYVNKTKDQSFAFVDEFSLAIRFLEIAIPNFHSDLLTQVFLGKLFYIDKVIENLNIPKELKYVLLSTISADGKKEFIGPYLDCISDPNTRFLTMKP